MKTSFKFLSGEGRHRAVFCVVADLYFKQCKENLRDLLFCLDLSLSRSTDHQDCDLHSLSYCFQHLCSWVIQLGRSLLLCILV